MTTNHRRPSRRLGAYFAATAVMCLAHTPPATAQVPTDFQGEWVAATANCDAPARARVEAARVTLINGADMEAFTGIEMAGPSYFGPSYNGIQAVLITEFEGAQPVTGTFNLNEKKGVAQLELGVPTPAHPANKVAAAHNARLAKLNLRKRFPLQNVALKRCPAGGTSPRR
jgi:hypothetical protein